MRIFVIIATLLLTTNLLGNVKELERKIIELEIRELN